MYITLKKRNLLITIIHGLYTSTNLILHVSKYLISKRKQLFEISFVQIYLTLIWWLIWFPSELTDSNVFLNCSLW